jgi:cell division protein FtsL
MNAAARLVHQGILSRHIAFVGLWSKQQFVICLLTLSVLVSAFCMIYVTYAARMLHAANQHELVERDRLTVQYSQLLLERSTLMGQSRVQHIAESRLNMIVPDQQSVVIIKK